MNRLIKRADGLLRRLENARRDESETIYMIWVSDYSLYKGDDYCDGWVCFADVGKPIGRDDWTDIKRLPEQRFMTRADAMAAAERLLEQYPPLRRKDGSLTDQILFTI